MIYLATIYLKTNEEIYLDITKDILYLNEYILGQRETPEYHNVPFICRLVKAENADDAFAKVEIYITENDLEPVCFDISQMIE